MTITLTIPDEVKDRVVDALCSQNGYQEQLEQFDAETGAVTYIDNPVTKAQFAKNSLYRYMKNSVRNYELEKARRIAEESVSADIEKDIIL